MIWMQITSEGVQTIFSAGICSSKQTVGDAYGKDCFFPYSTTALG
jgi:hypothetical protein